MLKKVTEPSSSWLHASTRRPKPPLMNCAACYDVARNLLPHPFHAFCCFPSSSLRRKKLTKQTSATSWQTA